SITHCRPVNPASSDPRRSGRATFTTVRSSVSMKVPTVTMASVHQRVVDAGGVPASGPDAPTARSVDDIPSPLNKIDITDVRHIQPSIILLLGVVFANDLSEGPG